MRKLITASTPSSESSSSSSGLSGGAKAGIAIACVVGGLALLAALLFFTWSRRKRAEPASEVPMEHVEKELPPPPVQVPGIGTTGRPNSWTQKEFNPYPGPETEE
jgi:hypothetical protein